MKKLVSLFVVAFFVVAFFNQVFAQDDALKAEAKFIYNFTRFVEWPTESLNGNFVISIYGSNQIFEELKEYTSNKLVGKRPIIIQKVSGLSEINNCQVLFIGFSKTRELREIKSKLKNSSTLIVTEKEGALEEGSVINFILEDDKLSYEIKPNNAVSIGLKLNSAILSYAKRKS